MCHVKGFDPLPVSVDFLVKGKEEAFDPLPVLVILSVTGTRRARQERAKIASDVKTEARDAKNNRKYRKNSKK